MKKHGKINAVNELADKIKSEKCDLTKQRFKEAVSEIVDGELSLDDLDEVAGGIIHPPAGNS